MTEPLLRVNLSASYGKVEVLRTVRFDLLPGEVLGVIGTSGAGKSTLILSILGLLPWTRGAVSGSVALRGRDLGQLSARDRRRILGKEVALIPQSPMTALNQAITLKRHFEMAWRAHEDRGVIHLRSRLEELLLEVHLPYTDDFLSRRPSQISVGQAQRVLIALAFLHRPSLVLADEPTSSLDQVTQCQIIDMLQQARHAYGTALLYVSHDLLSVLQLADRLAVLDAGSIVECLPIQELEHCARHPATLSLLQSLPVPVGTLLACRKPPYQDHSTTSATILSSAVRPVDLHNVGLARRLAHLAETRPGIAEAGQPIGADALIAAPAVRP